MTTINLLKYPRKSHRKEVVIPKPSVLLAEFFGIMIGDGGINNPWQANITLNSEADAQFVIHVSGLCEQLFGVTPRIMKRKDSKAIVVSLASTTVVDFLVDNGLVRGNKLVFGLEVPEWILAEQKYRIACVRGLMDTDGCLYVHRHKVLGKTYSNITLNFCSASPRLIEQAQSILEEFGIIAHINLTDRNLYVYKQEDIAKYLKVFSTSNDRISSVYNKWRDARAVEWATLER